ncbi:chitin synthase-domain-containing protein [Phlyctochytrium arcticum]|nr:chitin synthase-domain-containing protein [Phlyctochytrium arcticum]
MPNSNNLTVGRASISSDISGNTLVGARQFNLEHARAEAAAASHTSPASSPYGLEVYTVMLVTAYSEGEAGLRATMDSLAETNYSDDHKLMFIVADGLIVGEGKPRTTPQVVCDLLEMDKNWPSPPAPMSYVAIAEGPKRHNMAQVYVAWYNYKDRCIPTILVVKCGTPEENEPPKDASAPKTKPGNRGKRDSQIILMSFFQKITFDDQMSPLDYDLFQKIHYLMGVTPDQFEIVLMVDADTKVAPDSLPRMVASMVTDPMVMGLCGETRIANKSESWVSKIQVFEYYLSHHLAKAFESVFGGVTCLPGCFCMYRIKAPKGNGYWVPILCNPDIVATYSQNRVDTLHKKNLLLLGEDRFLTTLMLGTFPHRKQLFVPAAYCKTVVPTTFKVLLSQRRRWINSTIHNLMELVLVRKLCGVFCFSMQFVIMLELVGTVVLPAAIIFTFLLIIMSIIGPTVPYIPLALLGAILGLPAVLIMLTTRRRVYVLWMLIYLLALPVWNLVLPVYAFWHFDDFSWGQTRVVEGEAGGGDKGGHGNAAGPGQERDGGEEVVRRRWVEWETERRRAIVTEYHLEQQHLELEARQREQEEAEANEPNE